MHGVSITISQTHPNHVNGRDPLIACWQTLGRWWKNEYSARWEVSPASCQLNNLKIWLFPRNKRLRTTLAWNYIGTYSQNKFLLNHFSKAQFDGLWTGASAAGLSMENHSNSEQPPESRHTVSTSLWIVPVKSAPAQLNLSYCRSYRFILNSAASCSV